MVGVGFTSFLGGLSESAILVIVTLTADSLIRQVNDITIGPITMTRTQAVGVAVGLVVLRVCMTTTSAWIASRFAASVMHTAQQSILSSYLHTSHVGRSAKQVGDLTAIAVNHGRFTGDMANGYTMVATGICGLIAFGGTSIAVSPLATLAIAVLGGIMLACLRPLRSRSKRAADEFASSSRELSTTLTEVETLHREIEVFHAADRAVRIVLVDGEVVLKDGDPVHLDPKAAMERLAEAQARMLRDSVKLDYAHRPGDEIAPLSLPIA